MNKPQILAQRIAAFLRAFPFGTGVFMATRFSFAEIRGGYHRPVS
jgi:hypothetical protein